MKISDVKLSDIIMANNDKLDDIVFTNGEYSSNGDIGIVLGNNSLLEERPNKAIQLYNNGLIKKILVSGGIGYLAINKFGLSEAFRIKDYLISNGIPCNDIIVESKSMDTRMNIIFSLRLLKNMSISKIVLITSDYHLKRCIGLVSKNSTYKIGIAIAKDGYTDRDKWFDNDIGIRTIKREAMLLKYYVKAKRINNFDV